MAGRLFPGGFIVKNFAFSTIALAAFLATPSLAHADDVTDRNAAIQLCRAEVAAQAGVDANDVRLDRVRVRATNVRVDLDLWRNGDLQNIRCQVARNAGELTVAEITPALRTAALDQ